jgi:very-short-patch-repair endonuclease
MSYQLNNRPELKAFRRELRTKATRSENFLWQYLKGKQCGGFKFRRQHSLGNYIVDFYCAQVKLAIELDGGYHFTPEQQRYDLRRTQYLESLGVRVIRFLNPEVFNDLDVALSEILQALREEAAKEKRGW